MEEYGYSMVDKDILQHTTIKITITKYRHCNSSLGKNNKILYECNDTSVINRLYLSVSFSKNKKKEIYKLSKNF